MNTSLVKLVGSVAVASAIVVGVIFSLRNFDANKIACNKINETRLELQSLYDSGVTASVQVYAEAKAEAEAQLSQCINAKPVDPCAEAQAQRDNAVANYNNIPAPANEAPYADFQAYFKKRDEAYNNYKTAKATLDACRLANPPKPVVLTNSRTPKLALTPTIKTLRRYKPLLTKILKLCALR
jgi:hypothetical protein